MPAWAFWGLLAAALLVLLWPTSRGGRAVVDVTNSIRGTLTGALA